MLNYERGRRNDLLGSSMFSVGDMHSRLKKFKESLMSRDWDQRKRLYFVKLDIQSCFDTIPQAKIVRLVEKLVSEENYHWMKYVEMRLANEFDNMWPLRKPQQRRTWSKYLQRVGSVGKPEHLTDAITNGSVVGRRNTVLVDTIAQKEYNGEGLLDILNEHIRNNLVKIGKKYFRQRKGIPQGSVLSSLLCSLLYAEMERNVLGFLQTDDALLLRLLDDFLLITLDSSLAMDFLQVMVRGQPDYGISVNPAKSLVNFAAVVDGAQIPRLVGTPLFPYCGSLIDTRTLEIFRDQDRMLEGADSAGVALSDSLSIDSTRTPGRSFYRKVLASIKQSMHPMYLDSAHNSLPAVLLNVYKSFVTAAMKMYRYTRSLPGRARPRPEVVVRTIHDATQLGYRLIRGRHGLCRVTHPQLQYLGGAAFQFVLGRKQTQYAGVLRWLDGTLAEARRSVGNSALLAQAVQRGNRTYKEWRF
jgi:telomerase reverse transcriptase